MMTKSFVPNSLCWDGKKESKYRRNEAKKLSSLRFSKPRDLGISFGPDEIEINLKVQDSQIIYRHLAALCKDLKLPNSMRQSHNSKVYNFPTVRHNTGNECNIAYCKSITRLPANKSASVRKKRMNKYCLQNMDLSKFDTTLKRQSTCNEIACRTNSKNTSKVMQCLTLPQTTPTQTSIKQTNSILGKGSVFRSTKTCDISGPHFAVASEYCSGRTMDKPLKDKGKKKKMKKEVKRLRKTCKKKGKKIVKDFKRKEKLRQKQEKRNYKEIKKVLKEEIKERKKTAKSLLKTEKKTNKRMHKEEKKKLKILKKQIKRKCKSLKYMVLDSEEVYINC